MRSCIKGETGQHLPYLREVTRKDLHRCCLCPLGDGPAEEPERHDSAHAREALQGWDIGCGEVGVPAPRHHEYGRGTGLGELLRDAVAEPLGRREQRDDRGWTYYDPDYGEGCPELPVGHRLERESYQVPYAHRYRPSVRYEVAMINMTFCSFSAEGLFKAASIFLERQDRAKEPITATAMTATRAILA